MAEAVYILGGMGPQASLELYREVIECAQVRHGARDNGDFPEVIVHSVPVPDFISDERNKAEAVAMLVARVRAVSKNTAGHFAIACNTAHLVADQLQAATHMQLISMVDAVVDHVCARRVTTVGLLASPTTLRTGLYQKALEHHGIRVLAPGQPGLVMVDDAIRAVMAAHDLAPHALQLTGVSAALKQQGAELIVLGCTELPIVLSGEDFVSSTSALAQAIVDRYYSSKAS